MQLPGSLFLVKPICLILRVRFTGSDSRAKVIRAPMETSGMTASIREWQASSVVW
jgi:hypothetical protein